jgi:hypothetical protein
MAQHTSAGSRAYDNGLVLQARPEIDTNEFGLKQGTLRFLLANSRWPELEPVRATGTSDFVCGNSLTTSYLSGISFMAAQTARWTHGGSCPGVGILEVMCQGAAFHSAYESGEVTPYFATLSTTLEDLSFTIYDSPLSGSNTTNLTAVYATTAPLPPCIVTFSGQGLRAAANGLLVVDDFTPHVGNVILVKNQVNTSQNGLYVVNNDGNNGTDQWRLARTTSMNEPAEFVATVQISINRGTTNADSSWQCAPAGGTFIVGVTGVTFTSLTAAGDNPATPLYNVHLQYHSIDVHVEYMAVQHQQQPRYLQDEYSINENNFIEVLPGIIQLLSIEKVEAQKLTSLTPTVWAAIDDSIWKAAVQYPGTDARLEQPPAGRVWHELETTSIKIQAILPDVGNIP